MEPLVTVQRMRSSSRLPIHGFRAEDNRGWDVGYNFGSRDAARLRWRVELAAGVDLIATDQYEDLGNMMH